MTNSKVFKIIGVFLFLILIWYLFLKGYNYRITFTTSQAPGIVYSSLYNLKKENTQDFDSIVVARNRPFEEVSHNFFVNDSSFSIEWRIKRLDDSLTQVIALSKDLDNPVLQNLIVPFKSNDFVNRSVSTVKDQMNGLYVHQNEYKVHFPEEGPVSVPSQFCAYITLESGISQKGKAMMSSISLIMDYIKLNEIPLTGDPFLQVSSWSPEDEVIVYDFCFPIKELDSFPDTKTIKFKETEEFKGLKAIFNGNYRLSDRAWYELIDHAQSQGIDYKMRPLEIYRNDPHSGGNEMEWIAEVYLPVE